jgi:hypothetical protein
MYRDTCFAKYLTCKTKSVRQHILVLVESLVRGVSVVQLVFGLSNPRQSANFPLVKPKIRARIGQNVCPIRGEFAAGERFHQGQHISDDTSSGAVNLCDWKKQSYCLRYLLYLHYCNSV